MDLPGFKQWARLGSSITWKGTRKLATWFPRRYKYERANVKNRKSFMNGVRLHAKRNPSNMASILITCITFMRLALQWVWFLTPRLLQGRNVMIGAHFYNLQIVDLVTAIEYISASGWALPPCVIFKGKFFIESRSDNLPSDWPFEA